MRNRRFANRRLWVEELEPRVVLSITPSIAPLFHSVATTSTNWSGYAAETNLNSPQAAAFTAVSGSWTVPTVTGSGTSYSSIWVGLDGYSSSTVEQIGTDSDLVNGVPTYYAWYEMYPSDSVTVTTLTINPGDKISASVNYTGTNLFSLNLADANTGKSFITTQTLKNAQRSSAEWIVEAPSSNFGVLPLANFGTASLGSASASATLKGTTGTTTGPIDSGSWQNASINMVSRGSTLATTSSLTDAGGTSSFAVTDTAGSTKVSTPPPPQHHHWWWWQTNIQVENGPNPSDMSAGQVPPLMNFNQPVAPIVPLATPNLLSASASTQSASPTSAFLHGSSNGSGSVGIEEPMRNDADVLPDLLPPIRRPQAQPGPGGLEAYNRPMRPAPTAPVGELSIREDTPPAAIDVHDVTRPDTPAETREQRTGNVFKSMISLLGIVAAFSLFGEWKTPRNDEREPIQRDPK
jgi:Peptidase A4 family